MKLDPATLSKKKLLALLHRIDQTYKTHIINDRVLTGTLYADPDMSKGNKELIELWSVASRELHARHDADVLKIYGIKTTPDPGSPIN